MVFPAGPYIAFLLLLFILVAREWQKSETREAEEMDNAVEAAKNIIAGVE